MKKYKVTGMSCAACSARVERAVGSLPNVTSCQVNLLTASMTVDGTASDSEIVGAVRNAGYDASLSDGNGSAQLGENTETEKAVLVKRLIPSAILLVLLMYISMGHMLSLPVPSIFETEPMIPALLEFVLSAAILIINRKFFISGAKGVLHGAPNMDTLVSLGSGAAFVYSTVLLIMLISASMSGDNASAMQYLRGMYFEAAAMILALITVGKLLEVRSKGKTTNAIKELMSLTPDTVTVINDGKESVVPLAEVKVGDIFILRPGQNVPVDGEIIKGETSVNEATLTGESLPVDKTAGDAVSAGTVNLSGYAECRASRVGVDTTLSKIIKTVSDTAASKAPISRLADRVSAVFVPTVIAIAIVTTAVWLILGKEIGFALARGISVLVISCPCALGLATPVAIMVGSGVGARRGILFRSAEALENAGKCDIIVLDKTGTVTKGEMQVSDVIADDKEKLLSLAYSLEKQSEHPIGRAIVRYCEERAVPSVTIDKFEAKVGNGVYGEIEGGTLLGGSLSYISALTEVSEKDIKECEGLSSEGKTPLLFTENGSLVGTIALSDTLKEDSAEAIAALKKSGKRVVMLTGDNERTAKAIAEKVGISEVISGVLPTGKADAIEKLKKSGQVMMVGDGINDAPALTAADIGAAVGAGSDIAIDSASVVLVSNRLSDIVTLLSISSATLRIIKENLFWAFIYNAIGIPLAAGAFISLFGRELSPMFGAAAMSLSSFSVVSNALRLNLFRFGKGSKLPKLPKAERTVKADSAQPTEACCGKIPENENINTLKANNNGKETENTEEKEQSTMEKIMKIEGMMCMHCEARVKKTLEAIEGVAEATVSHKEGTAAVKLMKDIPDSVLKTAVEEQGYKVL